MFTFKLEPVLNYRKAVEDKKLVEFSEDKRRLEKEEGILAALRREQALILGQLKQMQEQPFNAPDAALYLSYIDLHKKKEALQRDMVQKLSKEVDARREALMEAVKNRKVMDKLKERKSKEYQENVATFERKTADETAVLRFIRNK